MPSLPRPAPLRFPFPSLSWHPFQHAARYNRPRTLRHTQRRNGRGRCCRLHRARTGSLCAPAQTRRALQPPVIFLLQQPKRPTSTRRAVPASSPRQTAAPCRSYAQTHSKNPRCIRNRLLSQEVTLPKPSMACVSSSLLVVAMAP